MYNLYIKTAKITKENLSQIPGLDLLPIFLNHDLRSSSLVSGYQNTAIHFTALAPSRYLFFKGMAGLSEDDFKKEYFLELQTKDWDKIFKRLIFLKDLSGAIGIVLMDGLEIPSYVDWLAEFLNSSRLLEESISRFNYEISK